MIAPIVVLSVALAWVLVSKRLSKRSITAPIVLSLSGLALASGSNPVLHIDVETTLVRRAVAFTLALVLFVDASSVGFGWFRTRWRWPAQLLFIGLPLCILANFLAARWLFPSLAVAVVGIFAAALAPTDAALGSAVMEDTRIASRIRRTINVESGLNDGLATPVVLLFIQSAAGNGGSEVQFLREIGVGAAVGLTFGALGAQFLHQADVHGWSVRDEEPIAALSLALLAYLVAGEWHGNGFIAAFAAGLAFGARLAHRESQAVLELTHQLGLLLGFAVWFLFGAVALRIALHSLTWQIVLFAVLSLTILRMVPVALASIGVGEKADAIALVGWLGPRGLASVVFALLAVEDLPAATADPVVRVIAVTVGLSVLVHGLSGGPVAAWYARRSPSADGDADEQADVQADDQPD